jgi:hypothetical protein
VKLHNKTIFIVAQEDWGDMFISKHHYASELAKMGNEVYYINGPDQRNKLKPGEVCISKAKNCSVNLVEHRLLYPYFIKFKAPALHYILVRMHINNIIRKINKKADVIFSFDLSNTMPLKCFPDSCTKVFMPVDEPLQAIAIKSAEGADFILSVTDEILEKYKEFDVPCRYFRQYVTA